MLALIPGTFELIKFGALEVMEPITEEKYVERRSKSIAVVGNPEPVRMALHLISLKLPSAWHLGRSVRRGSAAGSARCAPIPARPRRATESI